MHPFHAGPAHPRRAPAAGHRRRSRSPCHNPETRSLGSWVRNAVDHAVPAGETRCRRGSGPAAPPRFRPGCRPARSGSPSNPYGGLIAPTTFSPGHSSRQHGGASAGAVRAGRASRCHGAGRVPSAAFGGGSMRRPGVAARWIPGRCGRGTRSRSAARSTPRPAVPCARAWRRARPPSFPVLGFHAAGSPPSTNTERPSRPRPRDSDQIRSAPETRCGNGVPARRLAQITGIPSATTSDESSSIARRRRVALDLPQDVHVRGEDPAALAPPESCAYVRHDPLLGQRVEGNATDRHSFSGHISLRRTHRSLCVQNDRSTSEERGPLWHVSYSSVASAAAARRCSSGCSARFPASARSGRWCTCGSATCGTTSRARAENPFADCLFWREIGERAFGGWHNVDVDAVLRLRDRVERTRYIPALAVPRLARPRVTEIRTYADYYARVYRAAAEASGASVIVDSSKHSALAYCLRWSGMDLRVVHMVRDSRGVAYSWTKQPSTSPARESRRRRRDDPLLAGPLGDAVERAQRRVRAARHAAACRYAGSATSH